MVTLVLSMLAFFLVATCVIAAALGVVFRHEIRQAYIAWQLDHDTMSQMLGSTKEDQAQINLLGSLAFNDLSKNQSADFLARYSLETPLLNHDLFIFMEQQSSGPVNIVNLKLDERTDFLGLADRFVHARANVIRKSSFNASHGVPA